MSTIAEKLTQLNTIKQNQKTYLGTSENDFSKYLGLFKDKIEEVLVNAQQLYFKNPNSTDATFKLYKKSLNQSIQYSLDYGKTWTELADQTPVTIPGNGGICLIRGKLSGDNYNNNWTTFYIRDYNLECHGNIMYLYDYENPYNTTLTYAYAFRCLFENCSKLLTAPTLPATTLSAACYQQMFKGCTSLTTAPTLPATKSTNACYFQMFIGCTSLTTAPELPATTLVKDCYHSMFQDCTSLTTAPTTLPATTLTVNCYRQMFQECKALTTAPELPATKLEQNCYRGMFQQCTSLTTAPELKAATLADYSCRSMFYLCSSLNYVKCLATNISATECTYLWLDGVAESGTFVKDSSMSSWTTGPDGIPAGWTVQNA